MAVLPTTSFRHGRFIANGGHTAFMTTTAQQREFLGYLVTNFSVSADLLHGNALLSGEQVSHILSRGIRREDACDVGRDENNELVWIHPQIQEHTPHHQWQLFAPESKVPDRYEPENVAASPEQVRGSRAMDSASIVSGIGEKLSRYRKKIFFAVGVTVVATVMGFFLVGIPSGNNEQESPTAAVVTAESATTAYEPEQAALDFVLAGQVEGISVGSGLTRSDLSAHIVSRSGDIVLVEVQQDMAGSLTTFATLLLQKSGATWRIRQVFDPK